MGLKIKKTPRVILRNELIASNFSEGTMIGTIARIAGRCAALNTPLTALAMTMIHILPKPDTNKTIMSIPQIKVIDNELIVGVITETNQFISELEYNIMRYRIKYKMRVRKPWTIPTYPRRITDEVKQEHYGYHWESAYLCIELMRNDNSTFISR